MGLKPPLAALEARLAQDLAFLELPARSWVPPRCGCWAAEAWPPGVLLAIIPASGLPNTRPGDLPRLPAPRPAGAPE